MPRAPIWSQEIQELAYTIWVTTTDGGPGSLGKVAQSLLEAGHSGVGTPTLHRWQKSQDWKGRRAKIDQRVHDKIDNKLVDFKGKLTQMAEIFAESILEDLRAGKLKEDKSSIPQRVDMMMKLQGMVGTKGAGDDILRNLHEMTDEELAAFAGGAE